MLISFFYCDDDLCRFPNLCVAVITRESVRQAFRGGIAASQIIRFLNMQAHPKVRPLIVLSVAAPEPFRSSGFCLPAPA